MKRCEAIPGQELFQFLDDEQNGTPIGSADVNDYLREVTGEEFSAKDFRTWAATVLMCAELCASKVATSDRRRQKAVLEAVDSVAEQLGNTRTVCRNSYIHPHVIDGYLDGSLQKARRSASAQGGLRADERFALSFLKARARTAKRGQRVA